MNPSVVLYFPIFSTPNRLKIPAVVSAFFVPIFGVYPGLAPCYFSLITSRTLKATSTMIANHPLKPIPASNMKDRKMEKRPINK